MSIGKRIFHYLKTRNIRGETGQVAFDDNGDRMYAEYDVINIRDHQKRKSVGSFHYDPVSSFFGSGFAVIDYVLILVFVFLHFPGKTENAIAHK